jgi:hypothetical protein
MKPRKGSLILALVAVVLFPCYMFAQGGGGSLPPPCCDKQDPPPPEGGDALTTGMGATDVMPQVSISDAALRAMGITRSMFLDRLATALFSDPNQTVYLIIPVISQTTAADGSTIVQVQYFQFEKSMVSPGVIDTLDLVLITDGLTCMEVIFIHDPSV